MTINKYIGSRYVPLYIGVHDKNVSYEPLSIVSNEAKTKTYTSKKAVPVGVSIDNEEYWAQSGYFQDGIAVIHPDIYEVASYERPTFTVTKGEEEAELKLEVADSYSAGDSFGEAYVLNTLTQAGLYIIKPSACVEVPEAIAEVETPVSLSVILYNVDGNPCYMQQIVSDNAIYVRHCDSETVWGDWQEISGGGGSYTLPVASATKLGGVKIGSGINVTNDGTISANGGSGGGWETVSSEWTGTFSNFYLRCYKNDNFILANVYSSTTDTSGVVVNYDNFKFTINTTSPAFNTGTDITIQPLISPSNDYKIGDATYSIRIMHTVNIVQDAENIYIKPTDSFYSNFEKDKIYMSILIPCSEQ